MLLFVLILLVWRIEASWSSDFCVENWKQCVELSNNYKQPYCVDSVEKGIECAMTSLTNNLSSFRLWPSDVPLGKMSERELIQNYCFSLLWDGSSWRIYYAKPAGSEDTWDWQQTFDSHQSIFVYVLCSSFKDEDNNMPFLKGDYLWWILKDDDVVKVLKMKQRSEWKDHCSLVDRFDLEDCDMSIYATEIFSAIMSDIFKIKYAQVFDLNDSKNVKFDDKAVDFMKWYFGYNKEYAALKKEFPQTLDVLKSNQKYYKKVLDSVKIIDNSKLADQAVESKCPITWNMQWVNFIACALHSSQLKWSTLTPAFVTMIYNEILHYKIFVIYMNNWVKKKVELMDNRDDDPKVMEYESRAHDFQWYSDLQIRAAQSALKTFEDFNMTYPLHIWLLLYQEKLKYFRDKRLSPIITLFYSLSEKLQNVQLTK